MEDLRVCEDLSSRPDLLLKMPGVQLLQSFTRWCCGTVRYTITEEMLLPSVMVRRFLGNVTFGWDELSEDTRWNMSPPNPGTD